MIGLYFRTEQSGPWKRLQQRGTDRFVSRVVCCGVYYDRLSWNASLEFIRHYVGYKPHYWNLLGCGRSRFSLACELLISSPPFSSSWRSIRHFGFINYLGCHRWSGCCYYRPSGNLEEADCFDNFFVQNSSAVCLEAFPPHALMVNHQTDRSKWINRSKYSTRGSVRYPIRIKI